MSHNAELIAVGTELLLQYRQSPTQFLIARGPCPFYLSPGRSESALAPAHPRRGSVLAIWRSLLCPTTQNSIAVGTELLLGNIANTDAQMLSKGLGPGHQRLYHTVVGDNPERLKAAVALAKTRADIIITTGGLGPTCDDLTKNVLAECFGKKLVYDEESAPRIRAYFDRLHTSRPMTENNLQQAMLPRGLHHPLNDWGTAPGCAFEADGVHVIMLPGPPSECAPCSSTGPPPYLRSPVRRAPSPPRTPADFGMGESSVEARLRDRMNAMRNPTLAPYAKTGEVELRITAKADTPGEAQALITPVEKELCAMFGPLVYGGRRGEPGAGGGHAPQAQGPHPGLRRVLHRRAGGKAHDRSARRIRRLQGRHCELHQRC